MIFNGITALDAIGPYEVFRSVPEWSVEFVAPAAGEVRVDSGSLSLVAEHALEDVRSADLLVVPGGIGSRPLLADGTVLDWLREIDRTTEWTTSVCTGSLLLGAAGLLQGKRATGHWLYLDPLRAYGADPVGGRYVEDGKIITAAGVSAGIDMALYLVGRIAGPGMAERVQLALEYDPQPPFDAGSPKRAPSDVVEAVAAAAKLPAWRLELPD